MPKGSTSAKKRILIVEDEVEMRQFYEEYLSDFYEVVTATDGQDALNKLQTETVDLILLDIMMPRLDGIGFLEQKNADRRIAALPVVLLTNYGEEHALRKCFELGARALIMKSEVTPDQIPPVLDNTMNEARS